MGTKTTLAHVQKKPEHAELVTLGGSSCPICNHTIKPSVHTGDYELFCCKECGSWCSNAFVKGAEASFTYEENYFGNIDHDRKKWSDVLRRIEKTGCTPKTLLDVGCGSGAFLSYAEKEHGLRCSGIEINPEFATMAKRVNPDMKILVGDAHELTEEMDETYDLITLWDVFEHLTDPARLLHTLSTKLSPSGCIFIQTINEKSIVPFLGRLSYFSTCGKLQGLVRRTHEPHHLVFYSKNGIELLAKKTGLAITHYYYDRLPFARMDGSPLVKRLTSILLATENVLGNGLFINVLLSKQDGRSE